MAQLDLDLDKLTPGARAEVLEQLRIQEERGLGIQVQPDRSVKVVSGPWAEPAVLPNGMRMAKPRMLPPDRWGVVPQLKDPR